VTVAIVAANLKARNQGAQIPLLAEAAKSG
jgi:hypothetical protein